MFKNKKYKLMKNIDEDDFILKTSDDIQIEVEDIEKELETIETEIDNIEEEEIEEEFNSLEEEYESIEESEDIEDIEYDLDQIEDDIEDDIDSDDLDDEKEHVEPKFIYENKDVRSLKLFLENSPNGEYEYLEQLKSKIFNQEAFIDMSKKMNFFKRRKAMKYNNELMQKIEAEYLENFHHVKSLKAAYELKFKEYVKEQKKYRESLFKLN